MKGNRCPSCGELTFHKKKKGVRKCSSCGAVGWIGEPLSPGEGSGSACRLCGARRVRQIYAGKGIRVCHCYNCKATVIKSK